MSGQEKDSTQCGQTRKKTGERGKSGREKDIQHLNRNKRNVSHKSWMKRHAELQVHTRKPRATENMQMEKIHCYMAHWSFLKMWARRSNGKLGTWLYKEDEEPQDLFHRHWQISRQQTLEASPETQRNIQAKIWMDGIVSKGCPTLVNVGKKKNTLTGDFVSTMTNCCLHSFFMYLRETCILYIATLKTDPLGIYTQMTPLFLSIVRNVFFLWAVPSAFSAIMQDILP